MLAKIRFNYLRLVLPLIIALLLSAVAILWTTRLGILYAFRKPVQLSSLTESFISSEELDGKYASVKVDELGDTFSFYGYTDENEQKVVVERYCVYIVGDKFLTVRVSGDDLSLLADYDNAKELVSSGQIGSMKEVKVGTLTGTVTETLDPSVYELLCTWIKDNYLTDRNNSKDDTIKQAILSQFNIQAGDETEVDSTDYTSIFKEAIIPLQLETGYFGIMPERTVIIYSIIALVLLLASLLLIVSVFIGLWEKPLRRYIKLHGKNILTDDYNSSQTFKRALVIGNNFIWWFKGLSTYMTDVAGVIWAYPRSRRLEGGKLTWYLILKTEDQQEFSVHLDDTNSVQGAIDTIQAKGYPLVTGYDKDKQKLYDKDMPTFKARAKNGTL